MWWITLIIAAVLFVAFSVFLKLSYTKTMAIHWAKSLYQSQKLCYILAAL